MKGINRKKSFTSLSLILHFLWVISIVSCSPLNLYEKNTPIPGYEWKADFDANGTFEISDTGSSYTIIIVLRHTDAYKYNNIWLNMGLQNPGDSMYFQKIEIQLGNDANGWYGSGMNDIWEYRFKLNTKPMPFNKAGTYHFSIKQIMRDNPLLHVMTAGLRIEKEEKQ